MTHLVSKSGVALMICAGISVALVGCGRKPSLSDLKPPAAKSEEVRVASPQNAETLDGNTDGLEPVAKTKSDRPFLLDFLL